MRSMSDRLRSEELGAALEAELTVYGKVIIDGVNAAGERAIQDLVEKTKAYAPRRKGKFRRSITYKAVRRFTGEMLFIWGAKAPHHRLTHLLVRGHATRNGGRVPGHPFLQNALDEVLPAYEREIEEVLKNGQ